MNILTQNKHFGNRYEQRNRKKRFGKEKNFLRYLHKNDKNIFWEQQKEYKLQKNTKR